MKLFNLPPPKISVILPVYNGEEFLQSAIDCLQEQTFTDFECILLNDGSTDSSPAILDQVKDPRFKVFHQENQGLAATLNRGISLALGEFIARLDQDDISFPERFERQLAFLKMHPNVGMVGTWAQIFEGNTPTERIHTHPPENSLLQFFLLFDNPFVHSSLMIRKAILETIGGYSTDLNRQPPEDFELWSRIAKITQLANIPEILHIYREVPQSMSRNGPSPFQKKLVKICSENFRYWVPKSMKTRDILDLCAIFHQDYVHVSRYPRIRKMKEIIQKARETIEDKFGDPEGKLKVKALEACNILEARFLYNQCGNHFVFFEKICRRVSLKIKRIIS